jgi:hypothetical protein
LYIPLAAALILILLLLMVTTPVNGESLSSLDACKDFAYSTEEDFLTAGPVPADGNPIISDGDLLNRYHTVCARNRELLSAWDIADDLGLDAADVLDVQRELVAFSTELDDPRGRFKAGDLLITNGAIIPNVALLSLFQVGRDLGLDAVHFSALKRRSSPLLWMLPSENPPSGSMVSWSSACNGITSTSGSPPRARS